MKKLFSKPKRLILILGTIILMLFLVALPSSSPKESTSPLPQAPLDPNNLPDSETITINNTTIKNFYPDSEQVNRFGDAVFTKENDFQITYQPQFNQFIISITGTGFEQTRSQAEQVLLEKLELTQTEACQLEVIVTTPAFANPDQAGIQHPLSFCK